MQIKAKYYYNGKSNDFDYGGYMILNKRRIVKLGETEILENGIPFYYDEMIEIYEKIIYTQRQSSFFVN